MGASGSVLGAIFMDFVGIWEDLGAAFGMGCDCQNQDSRDYRIFRIGGFRSFGLSNWMVTLNGTGVRMAGARGKCHQTVKRARSLLRQSCDSGTLVDSGFRRNDGYWWSQSNNRKALRVTCGGLTDDISFAGISAC